MKNQMQWLENTGNQRRAEQKKNRKTKARRGKRIKNVLLKHFTIFYQSIRGIKSKVDSLTETVNGTNPTIIYLVETHMLKEEEITIPGYETVFREDRT